MHNMRRKIAFLLAGVMVAGSLTVAPVFKGVKVSAAVQEENVNLVPNGTFDEVSDSWNGWGNEGGEATVEQKDGKLVVDIQKVGDVAWGVQACCNSGFGLYQGGKYRLSFDISSSIGRTLAYGIQMNGGDYSAYVNDTISVDEETQKVSIDFTMTKETDLVPALFFNLGNYGEELDPHTVTIDNVDLELLDGSKIKESGSSSKYEENVNIVPNGTFDEVSDNWGSMTCEGGLADIAQKDGALVCDITKVGDVAWGVQASCGSGFTLYQGGKYKLSFDISSTIGRELAYGIQMNGGDYHAYVSDNIKVDEETQKVSVSFTMTEETDQVPALFFNMGNYGEELDPHTITIDNVDLQLVDASGIKSNVKKQEENVNLIESGDFEGDTSNWGNYTCEGGKAKIRPKDGALVCDITSVGGVNYGVQASCGSGFTLYQNGKYQLSFDINSTIARKLAYGIQLNGGDYHAYVSDEIQVDEETQKVTITFTMTDETDKAPALFFNMGIYDDEDLEPHTVTIDNVDLRLIDGSAIVYEEEEEEKENPINLNQVGFKPDAKKEAVVRGDFKTNVFQVKNAEDDSVVFEGELSEGIYTKAADETDYIADFTSVTEPGKYYVEVEGLGKSVTFEIGEHVFDNALKDVMRFFYLQRCGDGISEELGGKFAHGDCHQQKARIYGTDEFIEVEGGWHDAGDYGRYVVATSKAVADLLLAYQANPDAFTDDFNIPESGNGQSDLIDEIRGQMEWLLKMQNKENGGVYHKVTTANFPGSIPADQETGELIVCPITNTSTADFAAVMGMGYETFKEIDKDFADTLLEAGEKAYAYLADKPNEKVTNPAGISTGEYGDWNDADERYWAAASLYKATGDEKYHDDFKAAVAKGVQFEYGWQTVGSYGNKIYLSTKNQDEATAEAIKKTIIKKADSYVERAKTDAYGNANAEDYWWGSNLNTMSIAAYLADAYEITGDESYLAVANEQVNYVFGKNAAGTSYVTGYGEIAPQNPHHRPSFVAGEAIKGALVGGPNKNLEDNYAKAYLQGKAPAKCYLDHSESYSTNEVDIYWNSPLVRALAELDFVNNADKVSDAAIKTDVDTNVEGNVMKQTYKLTLEGEKAIDTSKLALRYYIADADVENIKFVCDYAGVLYNNNPWYHQFQDSVNAQFIKTNAGYYLEITLDDAVTIEPDQGTLTIMTRMNNADWSSIDGITDGKAAVYYDGKLVK
ncbi:glycoside hydrolase family 9 protein [[Clostridium] polysaccharolyticum]|uniref:Endoglucanase n=1 Tax=[Clostridium] polysaccharolyticum TaxID=29364 RepID=A0A1H9ZZ63_9FIRM|nr:glycoside hydrolase family 9 protein [[Clostridium] polysaccharolyticum]SES86197.1 Cellulose binding domain-containing protein [[Clostridium] polysaccharolyticum]